MLAVAAAFASALAVTFAATGASGEPDGGSPVGSVAVPIDASVPDGDEVGLVSAAALRAPGPTETLPPLGPAEALPALAAPEAPSAPAGIAPTPAVSAPAEAPATPAAQ